MEKQMVIVGAGIAGLSTGCYAQMNGFKTTILDARHTGRIVHGLEAERIHLRHQHAHARWSKSGPFHQMWQELGVIEGREFFF